MNTSLNPKRTVAQLQELHSFNAHEAGAQTLHAYPMRVKTRAWLRETIEALPDEIHRKLVVCI